MFRVEVFTFWDPDDEATRVVRPAMPWTAKSTIATTSGGTGEGRAAVLAHIVERGDRTIGLAADDDRLAVAFVQNPIVWVGYFARTRGDHPRGAQNMFAFEFEPRRVSVHLSRHR